MPNAYCDACGIPVPRLADVVGRPDAKPYALLLTALLENGRALMMPEVEDCFVAAGVGDRATVARALKRCRPDRPPVYRHGDYYHLDPYDDELSLWAFRLGLRPSRAVDVPPGTPEDEAFEIRSRAAAARRLANQRMMAGLRRAVVRGFPADAPEALVVLDVDGGHVRRWSGEGLAEAIVHLYGYDVWAGEELRPLLEGLGIEHGGRRLHELRPPQKTVQVGGGGKVLPIATALLLSSCCGIRRKWGDPAPAHKLLDAGKHDRLLDRLEGEVRALAALYQYGRLLGQVRVRNRSVDERFRVAYARTDEWRIHDYLSRAARMEQPLEVMAAPAKTDDSDPWAGAEWCAVLESPGFRPGLVTSRGASIDPYDVQRMRAARPGVWHVPMPAEAAGPSVVWEEGVADTVDVGDGTATADRDGHAAVASTAPTTPATAIEVGVAPAVDVARIRIELERVPTPVWREIEIAANATLWDLHVAIQDAMGWFDCHLHEFRPAADARGGAGTLASIDSFAGPPPRIGIPIGETYGDDPEPIAGWQTPMRDYLHRRQRTLLYVYDLGDRWTHRLELLAVQPGAAGRSYPRLLDGAGACPPEDCGGPEMYAELLEARADEEHPLNGEAITCFGDRFDPLRFERAQVRFDDPGERWVRAFGRG